MQRLFIVLCFISRASLEMQAVQHYYISRKVRSYLQPIKTGYYFTRVSNDPAQLAMYPDGVDVQPLKEGSENALNSAKTHANEKCLTCYGSKYYYNTRESTVDSKLNPKDDLKSAASNFESIYDMNSDFHIDDEDVRSNSRSYDIWPYYYHNTYNHEPLSFDMEHEKAKDKRFVVPFVDKVIPVHESVSEDAARGPYPALDYKYRDVYTTDNPIYGNQPFFSYVLNDYFDKTYEDEPSSDRGHLWESEFDHKMRFNDIFNHPKRRRRLHDNDPIHELVSSKSYTGNHLRENSEKGENNKRNYKGDYKQNAQHNGGFKDFVDAFTNRFGSENHNKVTKYSLKNNGTKGEKRKGFHKVYHKDEYQESNDFFDDKNDSFNNEEKGDSQFRIGGSEALLLSQAATASGNDHKSQNKSENAVSKMFDKKDASNQQNKGNQSDYNLYRDVAREVASSNSADYFDQ